MRHIKPLVIFTFLILFAASTAVYLLNANELPPAIDLNVEGQPTIGYPQARVHVVLFEEPKCENCALYTERIFPKIKREFIDTGKIKYTIVPVSFLPGSMPAAVALLCVYYANPDYPNAEMFFKYLDYMYQHQPGEHSDWATPDVLADYARKTSPAIKADELQKCTEMEMHRVQIQKNTAYGAEVMGGMIATPTLYVNGIEVKELTEDNLIRLIKEVLASEGVH